ncbi:hypothetical protein BpHYR1_023779 [Brachionus plicatilis]|uniref:Uncharacterized protein n=1 Tax=Brachionus plicatilis TaxID=10195 RepID=A0A3M7QD81_BRAPC|nr:hypothetical protein BpHYR1_023779 [Brachionus plicatilis]
METIKSTKKDPESKPPISQIMYNEFKNPQQPPNTAFYYSLIPEPYSYATTVTSDDQALSATNQLTVLSTYAQY